MIKIFRKIRQRMLGENKFNKYLLYAIGEIILVVIGILFALQINTWNIEHNNRVQEQQILRQLTIEYQENLKEIKAKIFLRDGMISSIEQIFYHMDNGIGDFPLDSLNFHIGRTYTTPTFNVSSGVTDELLSSGKLYLIQNAVLKNHLTNFSTYTSYVIEEEQFLLDYILRYYYQYMIDTYRSRNMWVGASDADFWGTFLLTKKLAAPTYEIKGSNVRSAYEAYMNDYKVENHLLQVLTYCKNGNYQGHGLIEKIELILNIIDSELESPKNQ
jgi:hypothetical protein